MLPLVQVNVGKPLMKLQCRVLLGKPIPTIRWLKMGEPFVNTRRVIDDGSGSLFIYDVQEEDEGEYRCVASNVGGNVSYVTKLDVLGKSSSSVCFKNYTSLLAWLKAFNFLIITLVENRKYNV